MKPGEKEVKTLLRNEASCLFFFKAPIRSRSPLLTGSRLISLPLATQMFQFAKFEKSKERRLATELGYGFPIGDPWITDGISPWPFASERPSFSMPGHPSNAFFSIQYENDREFGKGIEAHPAPDMSKQLEALQLAHTLKGKKQANSRIFRRVPEKPYELTFHFTAKSNRTCEKSFISTTYKLRDVPFPMAEEGCKLEGLGQDILHLDRRCSALSVGKIPLHGCAIKLGEEQN
ncbi:hypothetical protein HHK36_031395 (mitochondrion) [Tetracentron sinense]|uniref:Mitochondrial protein n=1 Tax=Tetracentron sinense TaxID=13715 RepID=A0A835CZV6_TETSI|nr:hypothetical protein LWB77_mgp19 [Tetracentron sinense]KAF8364954.1 hypothetical protein HHK36_033035 [Tetracentron sinense]KAF8376888.1 hypothetical protein HHK36_031395 [Tetracentron sinense]